ncbi:MAG: hypothetical protein RMJ84_02900 [Sandaracinaceae bacterium]|nr:hypothetical protein [Sandaracinaceae bacterium]
MHRRRLRNYLLDARFQLKYTGMIMLVTLVVATALGRVAYHQSHAQTQMLTIDLIEAGWPREFVEAVAKEADRRLLIEIVVGTSILVVALGIAGIVITHRVVGPAYKMKSLFREVAKGHLKVAGRLRHGDELQDVFAEFEKMIEALRDNQRREIAELNSIIQRAKDANVPADVVGDLERLRSKMDKALD